MITPAVTHNLRSLASVAQAITRRNMQVAAKAASQHHCWSGAMSLASPETDVTATAARSQSTLSQSASAASTGPLWFSSMSYFSPEADFTAMATRSNSTLQHAASGPAWSESMSFASPESDFGATEKAEYSMMAAAPFAAEEWHYGLSHACPEAEFSYNMPSQQRPHTELPLTFQEVLRQSDTDQALVITTAVAPHVIVHVNAAWENLCGFTKAEALHGTLSLIQGPDSSTENMKALVQQVLQTHETTDTILVNYSKSGRSFNNHLTMGPLRLEHRNEDKEEVQFLVGLLREVPSQANGSQLRVAA